MTEVLRKMVFSTFATQSNISLYYIITVGTSDIFYINNNYSYVYISK